MKCNKKWRKLLLQSEFLFLNIYMFRNIWEDVSQHTHGITLNDVNMVDFYFLIFNLYLLFFFKYCVSGKGKHGSFNGRCGANTGWYYLHYGVFRYYMIVSYFSQLTHILSLTSQLHEPTFFCVWLFWNSHYTQCHSGLKLEDKLLVELS